MYQYCNYGRGRYTGVVVSPEYITSNLDDPGILNVCTGYSPKPPEVVYKLFLETTNLRPLSEGPNNRCRVYSCRFSLKHSVEACDTLMQIVGE